MLRRSLGALFLGGVVGILSSQAPARAQAMAPSGMMVSQTAYRINPYYAAPGLYGMMLGTPSYGSVRTFSEFSSPYGGGYGYGYAPNGLLPGRYGVGLWRPGFVAPGYVYGASYYSYRTFPVPYGAGTPPLPPPPVGAYAPGYGPSPMYGW